MSKIKLSILCAANSYQRRTLAILALVLSSLIITGCGYHLSGMNNKENLFSPLLKKISIEGLPRYDLFRIQLKKDILSYRIKVVKPEFATTRILIKDKKIEQQAITLGDDAKVREYLLIAKVDFYIVVAGTELKQQQSIQSEATYTYYPQHVSISANEKKRALDILYQDMSSKLINRIRALTNLPLAQ